MWSRSSTVCVFTWGHMLSSCFSVCVKCVVMKRGFPSRVNAWNRLFVCVPHTGGTPTFWPGGKHSFILHLLTHQHHQTNISNWLQLIFYPHFSWVSAKVGVNACVSVFRLGCQPVSSYSILCSLQVALLFPWCFASNTDYQKTEKRVGEPVSELTVAAKHTLHHYASLCMFLCQLQLLSVVAY